MKKFLAILMAICMMASLLCVPAFAADELPAPAAGVVLRITAIKGDGIEFIGDHTNFKDGWNEAMEYANDMEDYDYDRIVVDLYADWKADRSGYFTDEYWGEAGFDYYTVSVPADAKVTLNLNGHAIDRGLSYCAENGEVMYIRDDADVIINNGTIKGGYSDTGAGGIHIMDDASVTLNNVHIVGNVTSNDDGGGIAMYDGASLVMNGGSFEDNIVRGTSWDCFGGAIYIDESTAIFNNVAFKNNVAKDDNHYGAAIYADESTVLLNNCTVEGNGIVNESSTSKAAFSIIHAVESSITVNNTSFTNNGDLYYEGNVNYPNSVSTLIYLNESTLVMEQCGVSKNVLGRLIQATNNSSFFVTSTNMTNNTATVLKSTSHSAESYFTGCTFGNNNTSAYLIDKYPFLKYSFEVDNTVTFYDCNLGNSTFDKNDADYIRYAYASVPEDEALIRVSALDSEGTTVFSNYYKELAYGWNAAIEEAMTGKYDRIVVDLYADWNAVNGEFCNSGEGFDYDAIFFPANVRVTLNMNGHTINRGMTTWEYNGEVMCVNNNADVIINDGTITGGWSANGAGGIHIHDGAKVMLNNVNVVGNKADEDDGAGIAVYDGATLIMNGGSLKNNIVIRNEAISDFAVNFGVSYYGGAVYVEDSTAIFKGVEFKNNNVSADEYGAAIYADNSNVTIDECNFDGNGTWNKANGADASKDVIHGDDSSFTIKNSTFTNSESVDLFCFEDSTLTMEGCKVTGNNVDEIFSFEDSKADLKGVTITDNASRVIYVDNGSEKVTMTQCTLNNNTPADGAADIKVETKGTLVVTDCDLGDTTFENRNMVTGVGSMIGEGNISMILSLLAIFVAGAAFTVVISKGKKKGSPYAVAVASALGSDE